MTTTRTYSMPESLVRDTRKALKVRLDKLMRDTNEFVLDGHLAAVDNAYRIVAQQQPHLATNKPALGKLLDTWVAVYHDACGEGAEQRQARGVATKHAAQVLTQRGNEPAGGEASTDTTVQEPTPPDMPAEAGYHRSVVTYPVANGALYDSVSGLRFNVSLEDGGTAQEVMRQIAEWRKLVRSASEWGLQFMVEQALATGQPGTAAIHRVVMAEKVYEGESDLYAELWQNGLKYAVVTTRRPADIGLIAAAIGETPRSGINRTGNWTLHYRLGNLKNNREGTKPWHFHWDIDRLVAN